MYEFGIELSIRDVQLVYKIKKLLGVGTVLFRSRKRKDNIAENEDKILYNENDMNQSSLEKNMVVYRIRNKSHLKNVVFPIFDKYPLLTSKQYDYIRFKSSLLSNIIYSKDLISYNRPVVSYNSVDVLLNTSYFSI
jgi:ubiquinol-cytochrome c reductase cytochrome b subunit